METALGKFLYLMLLVFLCDGFHVHGPPGPLTVQLGDSVMLPCFVETPLPLEDLEVKWRRSDSETLVHLWQDGESRPESQNQLYHERAHFFTEKIAEGNFSLLLTNVTSKDSGVYKCTVDTKLDSGETLIEIKEIEYLIVSGAHVISGYVGEDITLNCSVDSHLPPESIEEVSWRKIDGDILVLVYQEGQILTESTDERYVDRVEFFSTEERNKGNFSMRLKNVRTEDKGLYMCSVFSGELSANTTVEVQQLGLSFLHFTMIILCIFGFVIGSLVLGYLSYTCYKKEDNSRRALTIQCAHVLCPNITMSIVFILWGVTDGIFIEAATCSALSFARILFLFWIGLHLKSIQETPQQLIVNFAILLQYIVVTVFAYSSIFVDILYRFATEAKVAVIIMLLVLLIPFLGTIAVVWRERTYSFVTRIICRTTLLCDILRIIVFSLGFQRSVIALLVPLFTVLWVYFDDFLHYLFTLRDIRRTLLILLLEVLKAAGSIYIHYDLNIDVKERDALVCVSVFLQILTMIVLFTFINYDSDERNRSRDPEDCERNCSIDPETHHSLPHLVVFMFGTVGVVFVNAGVLLVELILKARNGERTVDLRLVLLPTESVFAVSYLALQISTFWKGFKNYIKKLRQWCVCKKRQRDSAPEHETENLNPDPQTSGS